MSYRWKCPLCGMTAWNSRFDKSPANLKFTRQISTGTGFQYQRLKHTSQPLQRFQKHYLKVLTQLLEKGIIHPNKVREVAKKYETKPTTKELEEEAKLEYKTKEKLAELESKASKTAKVEKEAKADYETMKERAKQVVEEKKEAKKD